jgi:hypothetical protein
MNCPIWKRTADGATVSRCCLRLPDGKTCPRHGDVSAAVETFSQTGQLTEEGTLNKSVEAAIHLVMGYGGPFEKTAIAGLRSLIGSNNSSFVARLKEQLRPHGIEIITATLGRVEGRQAWVLSMKLPNGHVTTIDAVLEPAKDPFSCDAEIADRVVMHVLGRRRSAPTHGVPSDAIHLELSPVEAATLRAALDMMQRHPFSRDFRVLVDDHGPNILARIAGRLRSRS